MAGRASPLMGPVDAPEDELCQLGPFASMRGITGKGIGVRFLIAFFLVCLTWNPTPFNYTRWAINNWSELTPFVLFVSLALGIGWVIFVRATMRSLGPVGLVLGLALAGSLLWIAIEYNVIDPNNRTLMGWVLLTIFAGILTAGMSWSHLRRRWSGQVDIDDVDEIG